MLALCINCLQLTAELDGLEGILASRAEGPTRDDEGDKIFDNISVTFKQFIVHGKDWIGNAKNLVRFCHTGILNIILLAVTFSLIYYYLFNE